MTELRNATGRAVFLDRDGTINVEKEYLHRIEEFSFIPGAPEAIRLLKDAGFLVIVVTNQSGIARAFFDEAAVHNLHRHMDAELAGIGTAVDGYYFCPHHPSHGTGEYLTTCDCRKPLPGMLLEAARDFSIELGSSYIIGDKLSDIEAGRAAGCCPLLVRTGYGEQEEERIPAGVAVYADLLAAARAIIEENHRASSCGLSI